MIIPHFWVANEAHKPKLDVSHRTMELSILQTKQIDRIPNTLCSLCIADVEADKSDASQTCCMRTDGPGSSCGFLMTDVITEVALRNADVTIWTHFRQIAYLMRPICDLCLYILIYRQLNKLYVRRLPWSGTT